MLPKINISRLSSATIKLILAKLESEVVRRKEADRVAAETARRLAEQKEAEARQIEAARLEAEKAAQAVRYMHPSNRALTWSGVGAKPDWVNVWLTQGGTLYALEVAASKLAPKPIPKGFLPGK